MTDTERMMLYDGQQALLKGLFGIWAKAKEVRANQKRYFKTKNQTDLIVSKRSEKELDELIADLEVTND